MKPGREFLPRRYYPFAGLPDLAGPASETSETSADLGIPFPSEPNEPRSPETRFVRRKARARPVIPAHPSR